MNLNHLQGCVLYSKHGLLLLFLVTLPKSVYKEVMEGAGINGQYGLL